jgi:hypothetical protein
MTAFSTVMSPLMDRPAASADTRGGALEGHWIAYS